MDKLDTYRLLIQEQLTHYAELSNRYPDKNMETHLIFDRERDHYMVFRTGWWEDKRIRTPTLYLRLHNQKIWIEEDWTEDGIATELLRAKVPPEDIVLAFHSPEMRQYTEFALA